MKQSESIANLAAALVKASGEMKPVVKDSTNPAFRSSYASLEATVDATRPVLTKYGLAVVQGAANPETMDGHLVGFNVETVVIHSSGEWLSNVVFIPVEKPSAQGAVSAVTYGRRAGLRAILCLADTDDDGESAQNHAPRAAYTAPRPTPSARPSVAPSSPTPNATASNGAVPNCPKCGGLVWDNREGKKNPKAPDFKCRDKACDGAIWPPKPGQKAAPVTVPDREDAPYYGEENDLPFD